MNCTCLNSLVYVLIFCAAYPAHIFCALVTTRANAPISIRRTQQVLPTDVQNIIKDMCGVSHNYTLEQAALLSDIDKACDGDIYNPDIQFTVNLRGKNKVIFETLPETKQAWLHHNYILNIKSGSPCHPRALAQTAYCKSREHHIPIGITGAMSCLATMFASGPSCPIVYSMVPMGIFYGMTLQLYVEAREKTNKKSLVISKKKVDLCLF